MEATYAVHHMQYGRCGTFGKSLLKGYICSTSRADVGPLVDHVSLLQDE